ncbi:MAG: integrin alpha [Ignavibacteria bacterium]
MKNQFILKLIPLSIAILLSVVSTLNANWQKPAVHSTDRQTPDTQQGADNKSDSLPNGVTQDWLNSLVDENGNRIVKEKDPETDAMQQRTFTGAAVDDEFGTTVSSAGDVNNDGFDDVIIGAPGNDAVDTSAGRAYIYYGGINMNTVADVILSGQAAFNYFGTIVSGAGDVNGDGYSDVIVSAYEYNSTVGRAYIYYGGAAMNNIADVTMTGEADSNYFGISVSKAGDVNGDGYSDVIVGASGNNSYRGKAYLYFGGALMNNVADVIFTGEAVNNQFGFCVSFAGDVNGDGYSDVIVGAHGYSSNTGRAYIFLGGAVMNNIADVTLTGAAPVDIFGWSVSDAGDVNADGYSDVIVGAWGYNSYTGRAYIFYGGAVMNNLADITITGETVNDSFGFSVSGAGDVNGDGYYDVITSAPGYDTTAGRAYLYYGGAIMNNTADIVFTGVVAPDQFGSSVSEAGDVNGDGYSDVIVGGRYGSSSLGSANVYTNSISGEDFADVIATGEGINNSFGSSVSDAGDVNGDGYSDVIVGAYTYTASVGRAYIYFGGTLLDNVADVTLTAGNYFGYSVSGAGDVNGDGFDDVIIGSYLYNSYTGRAIIYYGGAAMDNTPDIVMIGEVTNSYFGFSVSRAGDVNNDGYDDVIVGAYGYSPSAGRSYIYYGGASMDNLADVILQQGYLFGYSVSDAGDVNNDGYSDVIVGSHAYNSSAGRAMIFYGGAAMDNVPDVIFFGEAVDNYFGLSVSGAGDVNNDGYDDVIIGAYGYASYEGRAYIYYGGISMDNSADVIMTGEAANNLFGLSVSGAGDVNGDGYADVIVGAYRYSGNYFGRAYIYFGGAVTNNVADNIMTGETTNNFFGISVSEAGDLNGDGYSDVVVGASGYSTFTGRAYMFLSTAPVPHGLLNLTLIMEGFYDNSIDRMRMSDTARIYLRNSAPPYAIVDSSKGIINKYLFTGKFIIKNAPPGNYFIAVKHRNSIETWSSVPTSYTNAVASNYTFITAATRAFGNNQIQIDASPTRYAIYSGDVNHDGLVNLTDILSVYNGSTNFQTGYVNTDVTGDNVVNLSDLTLTYNNSTKFVHVIRP